MAECAMCIHSDLVKQAIKKKLQLILQVRDKLFAKSVGKKGESTTCLRLKRREKNQWLLETHVQEVLLQINSKTAYLKVT